jgi:hypothetical protein
VLADVAVVLASDAGLADEWPTDAPVFAGSAAELADLMVAGRDAGLDGYRLRPAVTEVDLAAIADDLVPALRRRGVLGEPAASTTLRARFGLPRPASRYAGSAR